MTNVFEGEDGQFAEAVGGCTCTTSLHSLRECAAHGPEIAAAEAAILAEADEMPPAAPPAARPLGEQEERDFEVLLDAFGRWDDDSVPLVIRNRHTAWLIMGALQFIWRHPYCPFRDEIEAFGRQIKDAVCDTAEIDALAEAGWTEDGE